MINSGESLAADLNRGAPALRIVVVVVLRPGLEELGEPAAAGGGRSHPLVAAAAAIGIRGHAAQERVEVDRLHDLVKVEAITRLLFAINRTNDLCGRCGFGQRLTRLPRSSATGFV